MNAEQLEKISWLVWLVLSALLALSVMLTGKLYPEQPPRLSAKPRSILWGAFIAFTFSIIPVMSFGIFVIPASWYLVEVIVASLLFLPEGGGIPGWGIIHAICAGEVVILFLLVFAIAYSILRKSAEPKNETD